ncbi:MAG: hypothetical protein WC752_01015 [Patescibacteria group bacterium]|jgi:hypothetical protein
MKKNFLLLIIVLLVVSGCTKNKTITKSNADVVNTEINQNLNIATTNKKNADDLNEFTFKELGISINLPFKQEMVNTSYAECGLETHCDNNGYSFTGTYYDETLGYPITFLGSVSENWSPPRDSNLAEVYDLKFIDDSFFVYLNNEKKN